MISSVRSAGLAIALASVVMIGVSDAAAQAPDTLWTRLWAWRYSDDLESGIPTGGDRFALFGFSNSFADYDGDYFFLMFTPGGDTAWTRLYGGTESEYGRDLVRTLDGGYALVGKRWNVNDFSTWLVKTDSAGKVQWQKTYLTNENPFAITQMSDSGFAIAGCYEATTGKLDEVRIIRTNARGDTLWTRIVGGGGADWPMAVAEMPDSGLLILGGTNSWGEGNYDMFLLRTNSRGDTLWTRTYGGPEYDYGYRIKRTLDGGFILVGYSIEAGLSGQVLLVRLDADANTVWVRTIGGAQSEIGYDVCVTPDGGFVVAGSIYLGFPQNTDVYILRVNSAGDSLWSRSLGSREHDAGRFVHYGDDHSVLVGAEYGVSGSHDICVIKLAPELVGVEEIPPLPLTVMLYQNFPNPCNPSTSITFQLPGLQPVRLVVYDILGREVATLVHETRGAGLHTVHFDARNVSSGFYVYRLETRLATESRRMVVLH